MTIKVKAPSKVPALQAPTLSQRAEAARRYTVFPDGVEPPPDWELLWATLIASYAATGQRAWPKWRQEFVEQWPAQAFGVANASLLILLHQPGAGFGGSEPGGYIGPHQPVLGGVPHLHVVAWPDLHPDPTWTAIAGRLRLAFLQVGIRDPWTHVMVANLIDEPGLSGPQKKAMTAAERKAHQQAHDRAVERAIGEDGRLDRIFEMTQPLVVLVCGAKPREAYERWRSQTTLKHDPRSVLTVDHPSIWQNHHGKPGMGPLVAERLAAALRDIL
jgi:hypothetical protein